MIDELLPGWGPGEWRDARVALRRLDGDVFWHTVRPIQMLWHSAAPFEISVNLSEGFVWSVTEEMAGMLEIVVLEAEGDVVLFTIDVRSEVLPEETVRLEVSG